MNDKKCHKCKSNVAVLKLKLGVNDYICVPCTYDITKFGGRLIIPFTKLELDKIRNGKKWTSLLSLKYDKYPFEKIDKVYITDNTLSFDKGIVLKNLGCNNIYISEGFKTFAELITALKKKGFKLPQEFYLYDLRKPISE